jgi:phage FluMu protein gp41
VLRVRTVLSGWTGGPGLQTFYFNVVDPDTAAVQDCVDGVRVWWLTYASVLLYNGASALTDPEVDVIDHTTGQVTDTIVCSAPLVVTGNGGTSLTSPALAGLVRLRTNGFIAGRRVQGKIFVSPMASNSVEASGLMVEARRVIFEEGMETLKSQTSLSGYPVVWSRPRVGLAGSMHAITSSSAAAKIAVLKSRRD